MDIKPKRFTIEEHEKRMRAILKPPLLNKSSVLNKMLARIRRQPIK